MIPLVAYNAALLREPYSGVEVSLDATVRALATHGTLNYRVYAPRVGIRPLPVNDRCTLAPHVPAFRSRAGRVWWEQIRLPRLLLQARAQVLHAPAYVAPLCAPCPVVLTIHDLHPFTHPQFCTSLNRLHYRLLMPHSIRRAAAIVVYSEHVQRILVARFPASAEKVTIIPPGMSAPCDQPPSDLARQTLRDRFPLPPRYLLFVGDLAPRKNLAGLLQAYAILQREFQDRLPHLVLAGAALPGRVPLKPLMERLGLAASVHLPGYVPPADLPALYAEADMLVFPSFDEGFGLPVLEAMACGCPVVCTPGGAAEVGGDAATLCDSTRPDAIAAAIRAVLAHPDQRAAQIAAGRRRAAQFRWEHTVRDLEALYRSVAREGAKPRRVNGTP